MKVLQINSVCSGSTGRISAGISRVLADAGHDCLLLYGRGEPANGVNCERFETDAEILAHVACARLTDRQGFSSTRASRRLIRRIEEYRPDLIQLQNLHGYYLDWRVLFAYLASCGKPVVWTLHDCNAFTGHCAFFDMAACERWRSGCGKCPLKTAYPASSILDQSARNFTEKRALTQRMKHLTLITPSVWLKDLAGQSFLGSHETCVIHNGVDRNEFQPTSSDLREKHGLLDKQIILGVANVWEPRKGLCDLIRLSASLKENVRIVLIGLNQKQIASLPRNFVGIERTKNATQLAAWYTTANLFMNPTWEDNFPTTQLESLACGTPVVAYKTGGCPESLDERCGIVVPKGDVDALMAAIPRALRLNRADCLERARKFDQQDCYMEYVHLYERLTAGADA